MDDRFYYVVTDIYTGGNLLQKIAKSNCFGEDAAAIIMVQLLRAVRFMHQSEVGHLDLRLENIMFEDEWHLRVIDFGSS